MSELHKLAVHNLGLKKIMKCLTVILEYFGLFTFNGRAQQIFCSCHVHTYS